MLKMEVEAVLGTTTSVVEVLAKRPTFDFHSAISLGPPAVQWYVEGKALEERFRKAEEGNPDAQFLLGLCYWYGRKLPIDTEKGLKWWKIAAANGCYTSKGALYLHGGEPEYPRDFGKAFSCWITALDKSDSLAAASAAHWIGYFYEFGKGSVEKNKAFSRMFYEWGVCMDFPPSFSKLGEMHETGEGGLPASAANAYALFQRGLAHDHPPTLYNLALLYRKGLGTIKDTKKAVAIMKRAADQGYGHALFRLAYMYDNGEDVPQSSELAAQYYIKGVEHNHPTSMYNLAIMYNSGKGVPKDINKEIYLFARSYVEGVTDGLDLLDMYLSRVFIAQELLVRDRARAEQQKQEEKQQRDRKQTEKGKSREEGEQDSMRKEDAESKWNERKRKEEEIEAQTGSDAALEAEEATAGSGAGLEDGTCSFCQSEREVPGRGEAASGEAENHEREYSKQGSEKSGTQDHKWRSVMHALHNAMSVYDWTLVLDAERTKRALTSKFYTVNGINAHLAFLLKFGMYKSDQEGATVLEALINRRKLWEKENREAEEEKKRKKEKAANEQKQQQQEETEGRTTGKERQIDGADVTMEEEEEEEEKENDSEEDADEDGDEDQGALSRRVVLAPLWEGCSEMVRGVKRMESALVLFILGCQFERTKAHLENFSFGVKEKEIVNNNSEEERDVHQSVNSSTSGTTTALKGAAGVQPIGWLPPEIVSYIVNMVSCEAWIRVPHCVHPSHMTTTKAGNRHHHQEERQTDHHFAEEEEEEEEEPFYYPNRDA